MTPRTRSLLVAALLGAAVLAGCGDDGDGSGASPATTVATAAQEPGAASGAMPAGDGGATVGEILAGDVTGPVVVRASVVVTGADAVLCDALTMSLPPRCVGETLPATDLPEEVLADLQEAEGVRWSGPLTLGGEVQDGRFRADQGVLARS